MNSIRRFLNKSPDGQFGTATAAVYVSHDDDDGTVDIVELAITNNGEKVSFSLWKGYSNGVAYIAKEGGSIDDSPLSEAQVDAMEMITNLRGILQAFEIAVGELTP